MKIFATLIIIRYNKIIKTRLWFHRLWLFYFCVVIKKCWYSFFGWCKLSKTNPHFFCFFEGGGISGENKNEMPSQDLTVQCTVNITRKDPVLVKARLRPPPPQHHHHHHHKCLQMEFTKKTLLSLSMAHSISIFVNFINNYIKGGWERDPQPGLQ